MKQVRNAVGVTILLVLAAAEPAAAAQVLVLPFRMAVEGPDGETVWFERFRTSNSRLMKVASRQALCYSLDGKEPSVRLGKDTEAGPRWIFTKVRAEGGTAYVTVQAAEGKFKDWYLDYTEEPGKSGPGDTAPVGRRLVLMERPKEIKQFKTFAYARY
jgi:hypothetical protein